MKLGFGLLLGILTTVNCFAQVKIHSHNDYAQQKPFFTAFANQVDQMEADIFLVGDSILVAHSKRELKPSNTLFSLYLHPIATAFKKYNNRVSDDKKYTFNLMIDVKDSWTSTYPALKREIEKYGSLFDRGKKKQAIQIVISGSRPEHSTFKTYPKWLFFDGLPNVEYAKKDLKRVTMISDNFASYSKWKGVGEISEVDKQKLIKVISAAHQLRKPMRFWGAPDTETCWKLLAELGADIINTDLIVESKKFFKNEL